MRKTRARTGREDWITLTEAAGIVGKSRQVIPAMIGRKELVGKPFGGRLFVSRASCERYRDERAAESSAA